MPTRRRVTHPSTNRAQRRVTSLIRPLRLPLRQTASQKVPVDLQGKVATCLSCGSIFVDDCFTNFLLIIEVLESLLNQSQFDEVRDKNIVATFCLTVANF